MNRQKKLLADLKRAVSSVMGYSNKFITIPFDDIFHVSLYLDIFPMS